MLIRISVEKILEKIPEIRLGEEIGNWQPEYMQKYGFDRGMEIKIGNLTFNVGKTDWFQNCIKIQRQTLSFTI